MADVNITLTVPDAHVQRVKNAVIAFNPSIDPNNSAAIMAWVKEFLAKQLRQFVMDAERSNYDEIVT